MSKKLVIVDLLLFCATAMYQSGNVWTDLAYDSNYGVNRQYVPVITGDHSYAKHE